jgi:hypothetical protein
MDQDRQVRLLVAPFFLYVWLALGAHHGGVDLATQLRAFEGEQLAAIAAILVASLLPVGFLLATIAITALRLAFLPTGKPYEAFLSSSAYAALWSRLGTSLPKDERYMLYASVTLDHEMTASGVHTWIMRRWSAFNVSVNCVAATIIAHLLALGLGIRQSYAWSLFTVCVGVVLVINAIVTWKGTMEMLNFQATRTPRDMATPSSTQVDPPLSRP